MSPRPLPKLVGETTGSAINWQYWNTAHLKNNNQKKAGQNGKPFKFSQTCQWLNRENPEEATKMIIDGASLVWGKAERVGILQPDEQKTTGGDLIAALKLLKGA